MGEKPVKISAYLLTDVVTLPTATADAARAAGAEWYVVHIRNGRQLVSCLAPPSVVAAMLVLLAPYNPVLIGTWGQDGEPILAPTSSTKAAFIEAMPDVTVATSADTFTASRPTAARDICHWSGWTERRFS